MKHTVHKSESSNASNASNDKPGFAVIIVVSYLIFLIAFFYVVINGAIESFNQYRYESAERLQIILKNECGMDYSIDDVRRNGDNLSRICGLKNETN